MKSLTKLSPLCILLVLLATSSGIADDEHMVSFRIAHADAGSVYKVAEAMLADHANVRLALDTKSNSIFIKGSKESIEVLRSVVESVDTPPQKLEIMMFPLKHNHASDLLPLIKTVLQQQMANEDIRMSTDPSSNTLVVSAPKKKLELISQLVEKLDQPIEEGRQAKNGIVENCVVRITWLIDADPEIEARYRQPNPTLEKLVTAMRTNKVMKLPRSLTEIQSVVKAGAFSTTGGTKFSSSTNRDVNSVPIAATVRGTLQLAPDGKSYELELDLEMQNGASKVKTGTQLNLPKNHPVAFNLSDVGDLKSAVVVQLLDSN